VGNESAREFSLLLEGLLDDFKPEGTLETLLVDQLATILWRKRRVLRAEAAEIEKATGHPTVDPWRAYSVELWDRVRSGEATGGMLKHEDNPLIVYEAIFLLAVVRSELEAVGFREDPWLLRKLYGLDYNDAAPAGTLFHMYLHLSRPKEGTGSSTAEGGAESLEDRKSLMLMLIDDEIKRLHDLWEKSIALNVVRDEYTKIAALVPPPAVSERLLRYETHLSREFDRTLSQLERLQRMRLGKPVIPPINVQVS
jgi:hypothetical protein